MRRIKNGNQQFGLDPIVFKDSEILILGSLPSRKSIDVGLYFANQGNRFWPMMARFFDEEVPHSRDEMDSFLKRHHFALWDVYKSAVRKLSSDSSMSDLRYNDIDHFLNEHPNIKRILVAGKKAQAGFVEHCGNIAFIPVPSTSGVNATFNEAVWYDAIFKY
ncbi:MAG: DNA-deoxyinosine glycosylase [Clostridia bacterium]|nr:DNA-deoxyinosine glycosylase [Clostridia bacterium]